MIGKCEGTKYVESNESSLCVGSVRPEACNKGMNERGVLSEMCCVYAEN